MGKTPAFQFYPGDWIQDTRILTPLTRGIWVDMLCFMWRSDDRGKLEMTLPQYARLLSCQQTEVDAAIKELSVTKIADVTECNDFVTVINRRMYREERERKLTRSRVAKYRITEKERESNASVTPPSSSSPSSSPSGIASKADNEPFRLPSKDQIENGSNGQILKNINAIADELYKEIWPGVHPYKNKMLKNGCNERAVLHSLTRVMCKSPPPKEPWAYCMAIMKKEDGNFNARDYEKNQG